MDDWFMRRMNTLFTLVGTILICIIINKLGRRGRATASLWHSATKEVLSSKFSLVHVRYPHNHVHVSAEPVPACHTPSQSQSGLNIYGGQR